MKNTKVSPLTIAVSIIVVVSIFTGIFQVVSARGSTPSLLPESSESANMNSVNEAGAANSSGLVMLLSSYSPAARVIVGTFSVLIGLFIFGLITRKRKEVDPVEAE